MTSHNLSFESATNSDAELLSSVEGRIGDAQTYGKPLSVEAAAEELRKNTFYFIKNGGEIVGVAAHRKEADGSITLCNVAILPDARGQGFGRAAMNHLLAQNKGASRFTLVTHPQNHTALTLYASLGFKVKSRKENYFGDGEPRLVLAKDI